MKKITSILVLALAFSTSFAIAAGIELKNGQVKAADCKLLEADANINLSKNVSGAYICDLTTNAITFGTCSSAGSRAPLVVTCKGTADPDDASKTIFNAEGCTADDQKVTISNFRGFSMSSKGGLMKTLDLGGACTGGVLATKVE